MYYIYTQYLLVFIENTRRLKYHHFLLLNESRFTKYVIIIRITKYTKNAYKNVSDFNEQIFFKHLQKIFLSASYYREKSKTGLKLHIKCVTQIKMTQM